MLMAKRYVSEFFMPQMYHFFWNLYQLLFGKSHRCKRIWVLKFLVWFIINSYILPNCTLLAFIRTQCRIKTEVENMSLSLTLFQCSKFGFKEHTTLTFYVCIHTENSKSRLFGVICLNSDIVSGNICMMIFFSLECGSNRSSW